MPQKVKNKQQKHAARLDKLTGNGKRMNGRQTMDSYGSGACTRLKHHSLVPSQYKHGEPWARGKRGYSLVVGKRGEVYFGIPAKDLLGEMFCWDDIPPKRGRDELESLGACCRS